MERLRGQGNSVLVVEHDLDVIRRCNWVIDLGPEAGQDGGQLVAEGTPEDVSRNEESVTGRYLRAALKVALMLRKRLSRWYKRPSTTVSTPQSCLVAAPANQKGSVKDVAPSTDWLTLTAARRHNLQKSRCAFHFNAWSASQESADRAKARWCFRLSCRRSGRC